jgi:hypothetical protein
MDKTITIASHGSNSKNLSNSAIKILNQTKDDNGLIDKWTSINDLMFNLPFHDIIKNVPVNETLITNEWKEQNKNPTAYDYYVLQKNKWLEKEELSNTNLDCVNSNDPSVKVADMRIKSFGGNRIQFDNLSGNVGLFRRAFDWDRHLVTFSLVQWRQKGTIHETIYVADAGGTFCAAALRGIESIQVQTTLIDADTREEFEVIFDKLYDGINNPRKRLSEWEKHIDKLAHGDDDSIELESLVRSCNVTFNPNSPTVYNYIKIPPVKAVLDWKVFEHDPISKENTFIENISGDNNMYTKQILRSMNRVWPGSLSSTTLHNASIFKVLLAMMGTSNGHVDLSEVEDYLLKIKDGLQISNMEINPDDNKEFKKLDATTSNALAQSLNLGGYAPQDVRFAMVGMRLWNSVCEHNNLEDEKVSKDFIDHCLKRYGKAIRYNSNLTY